MTAWPRGPDSGAAWLWLDEIVDTEIRVAAFGRPLGG
jgi:hypothetical protein